MQAAQRQHVGGCETARANLPLGGHARHADAALGDDVGGVSCVVKPCENSACEPMRCPHSSARTSGHSHTTAHHSMRGVHHWDRVHKTETKKTTMKKESWAVEVLRIELSALGAARSPVWVVQ